MNIYNNPTNNLTSTMNLSSILDSVLVSGGILAYDLFMGQTRRIYYDMLTLFSADFLSKIISSVAFSKLNISQQYQYILKSALVSATFVYFYNNFARQRINTGGDRENMENALISFASSYAIGMVNYNPLTKLLGL